jgi:hypothetical protein
VSERIAPAADSSEAATPTGPTETSEDDRAGRKARGDATQADLAARVELLRAENERIRDAYARSRRASHRRTAVGLAAVGALALVGAAIFPDARTVLFALAGTGLFAAALTYYVTPERFVAADIGERSYAAFAETADALVDQLGLSDSRVYVPIEGAARARLFVPQRDSYLVPRPEALSAPLVVTENEREWGASFAPTGATLYREFERVLREPLSDEPAGLASQLSEGLTETFELAGGVESDVDGSTSPRSDASADDDRCRVSFAVSDSAWGRIDRFDHPVQSFLAVGFAVGLGTHVEAHVVRVEDEGGRDALVALTWQPSGREEPAESESEE